MCECFCPWVFSTSSMYEYCKLCQIIVNDGSRDSHFDYCKCCYSELFPFNHYITNGVFLDALYSFFHLKPEKLHCLKFNPFQLNINSKLNQRLSLNIETDDGTQSSMDNRNCEYSFSENFVAKYSIQNEGLSILHLNARSLQRNFDELLILL